MKISQNQTYTLFSAKTCGFVTLLLSSSGKEQELGLISPGLVGGVGIDPMMAGAMSHLSVCRLFQEWGRSALHMHWVDGGWQLVEREHITGCEGYKLHTLFSYLSVAES